MRCGGDGERATAGAVVTLVPEMSDAGQKARHAALVAEVEGLLVALAAARVKDRLDAGIDEDPGAVGEGEEGVGVRDGARSERAGFLAGQAATGEAVHLAGTRAEEADAAGFGSAAETDGVGEERAADGFEE